MALAADPYGRELLSGYSRARERTARGLDRHGNRVLIRSRHAFGIHRHATLAIGPYARDLARGDAIAWDVDAIANNADWFIWFHHLFKLLDVLLIRIWLTTQCHSIRYIPSDPHNSVKIKRTSEVVCD